MRNLEEIFPALSGSTLSQLSGTTLDYAFPPPNVGYAFTLPLMDSGTTDYGSSSTQPPADRWTGLKASPHKEEKRRSSEKVRAVTSSAKVFDNGFAEDLDINIDPDYQPDTASDEEDSDTHSVIDMTFSLMDESEADEGSVHSDALSTGEGEVVDRRTIPPGKKRRADECSDVAVQQPGEEETTDYAEKCARQAAKAAQRFWDNTLGLEVYSKEKRPTKPIKCSLPSYTGTGRTRTYLREWEMRQAARDNKKITSFFQQRARNSPPSQRDIGSQAIMISDSDSARESSEEPDSAHQHSILPAQSQLPIVDDPPCLPSTATASPPIMTLELQVSEDNQDVLSNPTEAGEPLTSFLETVADEDDSPNMESVFETVNRLIGNAKKYKSFTSLFHLNSLKQFIKLWEKYQWNPRIKAPIKGGHHAHPSLLNNEQIAAAVRRYLTVLVDGEITHMLLMKQVNDVIIPSLGLDAGGHHISEMTAHQWLAKLGYELKEFKKGIYIDGHEREGVVAYRKEFLSRFSENERFVVTLIHDYH
ncbi:hypothetical protein EDD15DRAFT_2368025 [Pisolithus albus]|nr:hypothetical protein EDD15DRAFT_2368025 [Pisolithus albus]